MPGGGNQEMGGPSINLFSRIGILNIHLSQMKDIANLLFSLSSSSTLQIRNKLEMQVFFPSAVKMCVDGGADLSPCVS